jgi:hypothetical protein
MRLTARARPAAGRTGNVAVVFAVSLVAILSVVALALDGAMLMDKRRQVQSVADSAALAAANDLYKNWFSNVLTYGGQYGYDPAGTAKAAALAEAKANGYENGVNGCTVTVNIPPQSGPFAGDACHTEVIISTSQQQYFSRVFGSTSVSYGARSVSRGRRGGINNAILVLDPNGKASLNAGGNGKIVVQGLNGAKGLVQVNSNNYQGMIANGTGSTLQADQFNVGGSPGYTATGGATIVGPVNPNSDPIPDPLANLPAPDPSTMVVRSTKKIQNSGNNTVNLQPGVYQGGISATGGTINLNPGIYYMQGGGFSIGGQASLTGTGVMIYNAPQSNSDVISIAGSGNITLSPMLTGPYSGLLLFQDRTATAPVSISGSSGTTMTITGTFYAASATLSVTGNGSNQTIGSQYISYDLVLGGNGNYYCSWSPDLTPGTREILLVE